MPLSNDRDRRGADRKIEGCSDIHATSIENMIILLYILLFRHPPLRELGMRKSENFSPQEQK